VFIIPNKRLRVVIKRESFPILLLLIPAETTGSISFPRRIFLEKVVSATFPTDVTEETTLYLDRIGELRFVVFFKPRQIPKFFVDLSDVLNDSN